MIETGAVIVGAGPVGLFQVFQLGLQEIEAHVVDALPHPGGQCVELYGDKPIYDIPGIAVCTGRELVERLAAQAAPFKPVLHLSQQVVSIERRGDDRFLVQTSAATQFLTQTIFIAAGVGAFMPRKLAVPGLERFEGTQLHYNPAGDSLFAGRSVVVVGGDEAAVEGALRLSKVAQVTLLHRRAIDALPAGLAFRVGQITGLQERDGRLAALQVADPDAAVTTLPLDHLVSWPGLSPRLGPIANWGLAMERKQLVVDAASFATSERGVFAVGDVNTYPGKKKLILCGFHEATLAAFAAAELVRGVKPQLEYTTTSTRLHRVLGVG